MPPNTVLEQAGFPVHHGEPRDLYVINDDAEDDRKAFEIIVANLYLSTASFRPINHKNREGEASYFLLYNACLETF